MMKSGRNRFGEESVRFIYGYRMNKVKRLSVKGSSHLFL